MIHYHYKKPKLLFVGINPHPGSFARGVPFSNNKMFWYLLAQAGLINETREELREDTKLAKMYREKFNSIYRLGFVNIIERPTPNITTLRKQEEIPGREKINRIIKIEKPVVVCFVGKITYEKYSGRKDFTFGWQNNIADSQIFVMHSPLRGLASVRVNELIEIRDNRF